jgi:hypothetical protein
MTVTAGPDGARWLLLIHQLPAKPAYPRVKIWRRLHLLGAVAVKNAVHALPLSDAGREDFEWLAREIAAAGGEALIWEARLAAGLTDDALRALFNEARERDYAELAKDARALSARLDAPGAAESRAEAKAQLGRLMSRHAQIAAIDFFDAEGRPALDGLLANLESKLKEDPVSDLDPPARPKRPALADLSRSVWVTREAIHIDRMACAWLIRRFIDPEARFKFVSPRGYAPEPGEVRFDMYAAEFTHEGDRCSFEVMLEASGLDDPGLRAIAEIVHDIDLKDDKFAREEAAGIKLLVAGICADTREDEARLARGAAIFDDLYAIFRRKRSRA